MNRTIAHSSAGSLGPSLRAPAAAWHALAGWHVRPARLDDLDGLVALAEAADPGMTNLPADREALARRIERSREAFAANLTAPVNEHYQLVLDNGAGEVVGTACILSRIGQTWPFYSYKRTQVVHHSPTLDVRHPHELLQITNDLGGATEVAGLFLHPAIRTSGAGRLLARSRYLFIAMHRHRFAETTIAELRGWVAPGGGTPFWDALGRNFFNMSLWEADRYCSLHGNQLIADLMPKYPVYVSMLPEAARNAVGRVHDSSAPALRLLELEGLRFTGHVDIFDAGPSVECPTDQLRTLVEGRHATVAETGDPAASTATLLAAGQLDSFRCWIDHAAPGEDGDERLRLAGTSAGLVGAGDTVFHVAL
ncbi:arginine N-succinyltransferase [Novosphingobium aerophilum]|uniref:Arginine N-succinyltransferase n=1 Tax=Novosphingobium aerophilum TaxID=2839843 RepID=A0A7X1F4I3_9SPHN|nr:arginine N-succinyltransferase [Novosphingobium aerophilum]MBC2650220.1 arginine N-succinyltransferase [Novosphingobium aerophilum]